MHDDDRFPWLPTTSPRHVVTLPDSPVLPHPIMRATNLSTTQRQCRDTIGELDIETGEEL